MLPTGTYAGVNGDVLVEAAPEEATIVVASIVKESTLDLLIIRPRAKDIDLTVFPGALSRAYAL